MKDYIKVEDLMRIIDRERDREDAKSDQMAARIDHVKAGHEDENGRALEWLEKMEYKHDERSKVLEQLRFKIECFLS